MILARLLDGLESLRAREIETDTYELRLPSLPKSSVAAAKERVELIEALRDHFVRSLLWINELNEDLRRTGPLRPTVASSVHTVGDWYELDGESVGELLEQLYRGGWGMFFLDVAETPTRPQLLPVEPDEVKEFVSKVATHGVVIVSWYDDRTWVAVEVDGGE